MKKYSWSGEIEKAKSYIRDERISEAEACYLLAENKCSNEPEERFSLCLNLTLFYELVLKDLAKAEYYQELALKNLRIFQGYGKFEIYGHLTGLADIKRRLGKVEQAVDLEKEAEELKNVGN